jgi:hypothetical protein
LGWYGFFLLCPAVVLGLYYIRVSKKVISRPQSYLDHENKLAFWFLKAGLLIGLLGILISFSGIALSVSVLVAKSISHPPGLAISEPHKIIRPLDIFVLIVNFTLLIAHFVGTVITFWLGLCAAKARVHYVAIRAKPDR